MIDVALKIDVLCFNVKGTICMIDVALKIDVLCFNVKGTLCMIDVALKTDVLCFKVKCTLVLRLILTYVTWFASDERWSTSKKHLF